MKTLVLDVATETPRLYRIPYNYDDYHVAWDLMADGFDLNGQMCLVVYVGFYPRNSRVKIHFWVMKPPDEIEGKDDDDDDDGDKLYWDLRYSFFFDDPFHSTPPCRGASGLTTPRRCATGLETLCTSMTREDTHLPPALILSCLTSDWISQMLLGIRHRLLSFAGGASAGVIAPAFCPHSSLRCTVPTRRKGEETTTVRAHLATCSDGGS